MPWGFRGSVMDWNNLQSITVHNKQSIMVNVYKEAQCKYQLINMEFSAMLKKWPAHTCLQTSSVLALLTCLLTHLSSVMNMITIKYSDNHLQPATLLSLITVLYHSSKKGGMTLAQVVKKVGMTWGQMVNCSTVHDFLFTSVPVFLSQSQLIVNTTPRILYHLKV